MNTPKPQKNCLRSEQIPNPEAGVSLPLIILIPVHRNDRHIKLRCKQITQNKSKHTGLTKATGSWLTGSVAKLKC